MAAEVSSMPVNGSYAPHHGYGTEQQQQQQSQNHNAYANNNQQAYPPAPLNSTTSATNPSQTTDIPKDEVGWYFVEQYYTTLSRTPEKLYMYYNKRSQYVSGTETDKVQVCVGQRAINDRIKELDFQDCKVRITNVDSQASDQNIVIQVIGEISNKSQPRRKFTQTFVLATQTNGYFVLNDIFRYIIEEEDEQDAEPQAGAQASGDVQEAPATDSAYLELPANGEQTEPKTLTSSGTAAEIERDAKEVDKTIEQRLLNPQNDTATAEVNGTSESTEKEAVLAAEPVPAEPKATPSEKPEIPAERTPTPAASPPKQAAAQPSAPSKPSVPKTWASMAASANKGGAPPAPATPASQPQRPASTKAAGTAPPAAAASPSTTVSATAAPASTAASAPREETAASDSQDEWTAVGSSHTRQQSRQVNGQKQDGPQHRGYIKNVHENIQGPELREALEKHAKLTYFDIARQKNCAFVDFETAEGYQAAVAANPHVIGSDRYYVEERKIRPNTTPFVPRGQFQGGRGGRGDFRGGRGGYAQRGRGQGGARGARGGAQQP